MKAYMPTAVNADAPRSALVVHNSLRMFTGEQLPSECPSTSGPGQERPMDRVVRIHPQKRLAPHGVRLATGAIHLPSGSATRACTDGFAACDHAERARKNGARGCRSTARARNNDACGCRSAAHARNSGARGCRSAAYERNNAACACTSAARARKNDACGCRSAACARNNNACGDRSAVHARNYGVRGWKSAARACDNDACGCNNEAFGGVDDTRAVHDAGAQANDTQRRTAVDSYLLTPAQRLLSRASRYRPRALQR